MTVIDEYLAKVPGPQKEALERIRKIVHRVAPEAEEVISYGMPVMKYEGVYLIGFAPFKNHMSIFPGSEAIEALGDKLNGFKTSKGTVQFTLDSPIPEPLIVAIIKNRIDSIKRK